MKRISTLNLNLYKVAAVVFFLLQTSVSVGQNFTDSNLPIVIISTDINPVTNQPYEILDDPRVLATMKIITRPDGARNFVADQDNAAYLDYNGRINIEIRGSTSQDLPKKQYGLTTLQANNTSNNNVSILGMPSENDWILNGLAFDPSLIRDYLSYNLSRQMGNYAPRTQFCEVIINGAYSGLYVFQEKIKADTNRVNIVKIAAANITQPNLSGGYITKSDKTTGGDPVAWTMASYAGTTDFIHELPKPEDVTTQQDTYIHSRFTALGTSAHANNMTFANGYPSVIDVPSFVDFMISNELGSNADAYQISTFFHKDRGGKLRAGPIWDFNLTYGNDLFNFGLDRSHFDVWQFSNGDNEGAKFWTDLFNNPTYKCYFSKRWNQLTQTGKPLNYNSLTAYIDEIVTNISEARARENIKWGTVPNHALEISNLKTFIQNRINWINSHIGGFAACENVEVPNLVINKINYNPGTDANFPVSNDQEFIEIKNAGSTTVNLTGVYLSELGLSYQFPENATIAAGQSVFIVSNLTVFEAKYGFAAFGQFSRNLSNSKQKLVLADGFGNVIDIVEYFDASPWPNADGNGSYLQLTDTQLDNNLASSWIASSSLVLSSDSFALAENVSFYPNPVKNELTVNATNVISNVEVYDIYGKLLRRINGNSKSATIDFSEYSNGVYLVKISSSNKTRIEKIIKQ